MKRRFIYFTDDELDVLEESLLGKNNLALIKEIRKERKEREYNRKRQDEWLKNQPKIYCC